MSDGQNQTQKPDDRVESEVLKLKRVQTLITVAFIAGPVSLIYGGVLLSAISLVCAILAFRMARNIDDGAPQDVRQLASSLQSQTTVALMINIATTALSSVSFILSAAALIGLVQSGQLDEFLASSNVLGLGSAGSEAVDSGKSIWD